MRSYGQFCGLARTLDVVGDRWTLLLIRELAIRPCRYRDLRDGLPGIATNLLADRLRQLERDGVVERTEVPAPVAASLYRLTPLGRRLIPIILDMAAWGAAWMRTANRASTEQGDDVFRGRWLVLAVPALLREVTEGIPDMRVRMDVGDEAVAFEIREGVLHASVDQGGRADLSITTSPETALSLLTGGTTLDGAAASDAADVIGPVWAVQAFEALATAARARLTVDAEAPGEAVTAYLG